MEELGIKEVSVLLVLLITRIFTGEHLAQVISPDSVAVREADSVGEPERNRLTE